MILFYDCCLLSYYYLLQLPFSSPAISIRMHTSKCSRERLLFFACRPLPSKPRVVGQGGHWGSGALIFTGLLDEQEGPWQNGIQLQKAYNRPMLRRRSCWKEQQGILYPWKGDIALHSKQKNDAGWEAWSGPLNCLRLRPPCKYLSLIDNASAKTRIFQA